MESVMRWIRPELKNLSKLHLVEHLHVFEQSFDLGLGEALPLFVVLFILGEDLNFDEVLVRLEEVELFEKAIPADL